MGGTSWSDTVKMGEYTLRNRVVMESMTRCRCGKEGVPNDLVATYYAQRASAGLICSEVTAISPRANSYPGTACLYNQDHVAGWKKVTKAVHDKGGLIFVQLYHAGRQNHSQKTGGLEPWAPSPIALRGKIKELGDIDYETPKEMTVEDIEAVKGEFENSFKLAKEAGLDGIHLHASYGFLIDQFLRSFTNHRTDNYGGSVENRARFCLEVVDIALKHFKPYQVGLKLSPTGRMNDAFDEHPVETFTYLLGELNKRNIGYIDLVESEKDKDFGKHIHPKEQIANTCKTFRPLFKGIIFANNGFDPKSGIDKLKDGDADCIAFAKWYISNPDLADKLISETAINEKVDFSTAYFMGEGDPAKGYTDYEPAKK